MGEVKTFPKEFRRSVVVVSDHQAELDRKSPIPKVLWWVIGVVVAAFVFRNVISYALAEIIVGLVWLGVSLYKTTAGELALAIIWTRWTLQAAGALWQAEFPEYGTARLTLAQTAVRYVARVFRVVFMLVTTILCFRWLGDTAPAKAYAAYGAFVMRVQEFNAGHLALLLLGVSLFFEAINRGRPKKNQPNQESPAAPDSRPPTAA